jgi:copper chaperone
MLSHEFTVHGMTCNQCVVAITQAVRRADSAAVVAIDLSQQRVRIESDFAREALAEIILDEGFVVA